MSLWLTDVYVALVSFLERFQTWLRAAWLFLEGAELVEESFSVVRIEGLEIALRAPFESVERRLWSIL